MAKCVWCGRHKRLFEQFNKYGFCSECKVRVRQEIEDKIADVNDFIILYKGKTLKESDDKLCKLVEKNLAVLDELEELRERVPMFKSSTEHLRNGLLVIKREIEGREQQAQSSRSASGGCNLTGAVPPPLVYLPEYKSSPPSSKWSEKEITSKKSGIPLDAVKQLKDIGTALVNVKISSDPNEQITAYENLQFIQLALDQLKEKYGHIDAFNIKAAPYQNEIQGIRQSMAELSDCQTFNRQLSSIEHAKVIVEKEGALNGISAKIPSIKFTNVIKTSKREVLGNFIAVDVETTGLNPNNDAITEVSAIKFLSFEPEKIFTTLVNPGRDIPFAVTKLTGINNGMVSGQPLFCQIVKSLAEFMDSDTIVGHNLKFDLGFLFAGGFDVFSRKRRFYDTLSLAKKALPQYRLVYYENGYYERDYNSAKVPNYKLETLCNYYQINRATAHRSASDCLATGLLFKELVNEILD